MGVRRYAPDIREALGMRKLREAEKADVSGWQAEGGLTERENIRLEVFEKWLSGYRLDPVQLRALERMIDVSQRIGAVAVIVRLPVSRGLLALGDRMRAWQAMDPELQRLQRDRSVRVLDLLKMAWTTPLEFSDCSHVAKPSYSKVSSEFCRLLDVR